MTGIAPHHLQHHDPIMAGGRGLQPVESLGRHGHRGIVANCDLGLGDIVVDRLGDRHQAEAALLRQLAQDVLTAVSADSDQRLDSEQTQAFDHLFRTVAERAVRHRIGEGVALVRGAQDGARLTQERTVEHVQAELPRARRPVHQAARPLFDTDHCPAMAFDRTMDDGAQRRVQAGAIAAAGEHAETHGSSSCPAPADIAIITEHPVA